MARDAHVWPETPRGVGDEVEVAATVEWPAYWPRFWKDRRQRVFVRVPGDVRPSEGATADAFLLATVFGAMRRARTLRVHAPVTGALVEGLARLVELWTKRRPDKYHPIEIVADARVPAAPEAPPDSPAILCFSGGLDSAYSLFRHTEPGVPAAGPPLGAALMLAGADIPVGEEAAFGRAFERSRRMTDSRGVPLLRAATNLRVVKQNWTHSSNTALAAVTNLFRGRYAAGLVAVGFTVPEALAWWPQDVTDLPLVSSASFPVVGDGYEADRFEKLYAIRDWPEAMRDLRVCYAPGVWDRNCGGCLKCLTAVLFAKVACERAPPFMPREATEADVHGLAACRDPNGRLRLAQLARHARALGSKEPWLPIVDEALRAAGVAVPETAP